MKTEPPFFLVGRVGWGKELFPVSACLQEYGLSSTTPTSRRVPRPPPAPSRGRAVSGDSQGEAVLLRKQDLRGVSQVRPRSSGLLPGECIDGASPPRWELTGRGTETLPLLSLASPGKHPSSTRRLFQSLGNCVLQNPGYAIHSDGGMIRGDADHPLGIHRPWGR